MPRYVAFLFVFLIIGQACQRKPYATYQSGPRDRYDQPRNPSADRRSSDRRASDRSAPPEPDQAPEGDVIDRMAGGLERLVKPNPAESEERSADQNRRTSDRRASERQAYERERTTRPSERSASPRERSESANMRRQEPPKRLGNRIRGSLGLPERKPLNWWQRIPWQLKAAPFVIGVAVAFAFLKITLLAIIFGLLGAFLLIRGLKRSFKVRRPWL